MRRPGLSPAHYARCLNGIVRREALRWINQRGRFVSAMGLRMSTGRTAGALI